MANHKKSRPANLPTERFSCPLEIHAVDKEQNTFTARTCKFGNLVTPQPPAMIATFIMPGAFRKTLEENANGNIKVMRQHEELIGVSRSGYEGKDGVYITAKISETNTGKDTLTLMRDKALTEMSHGWRPIRAQFVSGKELLEKLSTFKLDREISALVQTNVEEYGVTERYRLVWEAALPEVSIVDWGADDMTHIDEVNKKIAPLTPEQAAMMTDQDICQIAHDLAVQLVEIFTPQDNGDGIPFYDPARYWQRMSQARAITYAINAITDCSPMMPEAMALVQAALEKNVGARYSAATKKKILDYITKQEEGLASLKEMINAAEPQSEDSALQSKPPENQALLNERRERDKRMRERNLRILQLKSGDDYGTFGTVVGQG